MNDDYISLTSPITRTYIAHATLMTIKLLCCNPVLWRPVTSFVKTVTFSDADVIRRAYLAELKCLVPYWVLGGLYITIDPPLRLTKNLFRTFSVARLIVFLGNYSNLHRSRSISNLHEYCADVAGVVSYLITIYMAVFVIAYYIYFL